MNTVVSTPDLTITETLCDAMWQINLWPGVTHTDLPKAPSIMVDGVARTGPLTWVVFDGDKPNIDEADGTVTDLCHSRKHFRIEGTMAGHVIIRLAPLDFRERAFSDGTFKATIAHHMSVWIARNGGVFDVWVGFTFAGAFRELLEETAAQWEDA